MKTNKLSLVISTIALIGVIILFVAKPGAPKQTKNTTTENSKQKIGYVNIDSVLVKYDLYNVLSLQLTNKQQKLDKELKSKALSLQNRMIKLQQQYDQHLITTQTYQQKAQKLTNEQQQLQQWQQKKLMELNEDQMNLSQRVYDSIISAVKFFNKDKKYNLIISNTATGPATLLYGDTNLDITNEIVKIMNEKAPVLDSTNVQ